MEVAELLGIPGVLPDDPGGNTVLVVDDDLNQRMLMMRIMRAQGYQVTLAANTQEARGQLREGPVSLVVTDLRMYSEDGLELVRHVADVYPDTRSVVVSGFGPDDDTVRRAGAVAQLSKPLDRDAFVALVAEIMENRKESYALRRHRAG